VNGFTSPTIFFADTTRILRRRDNNRLTSPELKLGRSQENPICARTSAKRSTRHGSRDAKKSRTIHALAALVHESAPMFARVAGSDASRDSADRVELVL
jgi:hypothetical protein